MVIEIISMKFIRGAGVKIKYIFLIFAIFFASFIYTSKISAQTFPPFDFSNLNNFNFSNILDFADDFIPEISDIAGNLPSDPVNLLNTLTNGVIGTNVLNGNDFISTLFQITNSKNPDDAMSGFLSKVSDTLPPGVQTLVTSFNPQTGLFEIIGAVIGKNTFFDSLLGVVPNRKYETQNIPVVINNTEYSDVPSVSTSPSPTSQCTCSCRGSYSHLLTDGTYGWSPDFTATYTVPYDQLCSSSAHNSCDDLFLAKLQQDAAQNNITRTSTVYQCDKAGL